MIKEKRGIDIEKKCLRYIFGIPPEARILVVNSLLEVRPQLDFAKAEVIVAKYKRRGDNKIWVREYFPYPADLSIKWEIQCDTVALFLPKM